LEVQVLSSALLILLEVKVENFSYGIVKHTKNFKEKFKFKGEKINKALLSLYLKCECSERKKLIEQKIIENNITFVIKICNMYYTYLNDEKDDIFNEGIRGILEAIRRYDDTFEFRFSTFAVWWIRAYIKRYLDLTLNGSIRLPAHIIRQNIKNFKEYNSKDVISSFYIDIDHTEDTNKNHDTYYDNKREIESFLNDTDENPLFMLEKKNYSEHIKRSLRVLIMLKELEGKKDSTYCKLVSLIVNELKQGNEKISFNSFSPKLGVSRQRVKQLKDKLKEDLELLLTF